LPAVRTLGLANSVFADALARELASSKILRQLRELDLSKGTMSDVGGRAILEHAGAFSHLERLVLSHNYLSSTMCTSLAVTPGDRVELVDQGDADLEDDERYVQISE